MESLTETLQHWSLFWILFIPLTVWVLKFYRSKNSSLIKKLWLISLLIQAVLIPLFFLPWIPVAQGGQSGFQLAVGGDWWVAFYIFLAVLSLGLSLSSKTPLLKAGAGVHVANSIYLMAVLVKLFPESIKLSWTDVAPVISVMALLIGNVAVLLLWNELGKGFELKA